MKTDKETPIGFTPMGYNGYRINVLDKHGKEVWRYSKTIKRARAMQLKAIESGVNSFIYQKKAGKYQVI